MLATKLFILIAIGAGFALLEWRFPARSIELPRQYLHDLIPVLTFLGVFLWLSYLMRDWYRPLMFREYLDTLPAWLRLMLYFVVADFGLYWVHRWMHTDLLWSTHRWHHVPTRIYWFAGLRASFPHQFLFNLTSVIGWPLMFGFQWWVYLAIFAETLFRNSWMHANLTWRLRPLEWVFVTPHFHHVHHSDNPAHYKRNLGSLFTVWDRLFGTYLDPDQIQAPLKFGIHEKPNPIRLVAGV